MILRPDVKIVNNVFDMPEFKEVGRNIIIYIDNNNISDEHEIAVINNSIQVGSVGVLQRNTEILYAINSYYGKIKNPLYYNPAKKSMDVNMNATLLIESNSYIYKMIDTFKEDHITTNLFDGEFYRKFARYKNDRREILPSDPRYYNIDHQIKMTGSDCAFATEDKLYVQCARNGDGVPYILNELVDSITEIRATNITIDDPYRMLKHDTDYTTFINNLVSRIINFALLALIDRFTVILDTDMGFNILEAKRSFRNIEKKYERFEISSFFTQIENEYSELMDSQYRMRITIKYMKYQTHIQILPPVNNITGIKINSDVLDSQLIDMIETSFIDTQVDI